MTHVCPRCATQLDRAVQGLCPRCLLDRVLLDDPEPSDDPSRFRIVTLLGRGPHGTTYLAEQDEEPRFVSLKIVGGASSDAARNHLAAIRRALLDARHPCLAAVVGVDAGEAPSVAAEYLQGRKATGAGDDLVFHLAGLASAIAYLHDRGIVHANIHASNVLTLPGAPRSAKWRLIDFAAARPIDSDDDALVDLAAFGAFMRGVLDGGSAASTSSLAAIVRRAMTAGATGGYRSAADLARDLDALAS